jgi:hypothetical protein
MNLKFSQQVFKKSSNIKFHENPSSGSWIAPRGQTNTKQLIDTFRNFANTPKNDILENCYNKQNNRENKCAVLPLAISWLAENLLASQEGLCSMELVS